MSKTTFTVMMTLKDDKVQEAISVLKQLEAKGIIHNLSIEKVEDEKPRPTRARHMPLSRKAQDTSSDPC
jgi:hypothetical protein